MGKVVVLYHSVKGNTKKMAELVSDGARKVPGTEVRLLPVEKASVDDIFWCDGIAVGSPTYVGLVSAEMKTFWDSLVKKAWGKIDGKIGCAFSSSGGRGGGSELTCQSIITILLNFGMFVFGIPDYTGPGQTLHYGAVSAGAPAEGAESDACVRLGRRLAEWVAFYCDGDKAAHPLKQKNKRK